MGDGADMALDAVMSEEEARLDFHSGCMTKNEAYDRGIIDELGYEHNDEIERRRIARRRRKGD